MKYCFQIAFLSFILLFLTGARGDLKNPPPGTIRLTDSVYIDKFPVKIKDYIEFLSSIKSFYSEACHDSLVKLPKFGLSDEDIQGLMKTFQGDSILYLKMLTRTWVTYSNDERRYDIDYHLKSPKFYDFPVVNITIEQMRYYCQWRTDMVMLYYATNCKNEKKRLKYPMNFKYRLIKRKEWELSISEFFYDIKKKKTDNKVKSEPDNVLKPYLYEKDVEFYYDTENAAETLDNEIVTFDFVWNSSVKIGNISYFKFEEPCDWVTFRCACEILPEEPAK